MILHDLEVDTHAFEAATGWSIKAEGACKGEVCVALPEDVRVGDAKLAVEPLAARLGMPLVRDDALGVMALGPATAVTGRVLTTAVAPDLELPDADGNPFKLSSLLGQKVLLVAWASW